MKKRRYKYIIGIDEVGRGALAGPVTVAAIAAAVNSKFKILNLKLKLRDSKKLSPKQREIWFGWIKLNQKLHYATASVSPKVIDKINIARAANLAATRALQKLLNTLTIVKLLSKREVRVFLDGGLYLDKLKIKNKKLKTQIKNTKTIIRGDEKIRAIMLASIVAKITRDRKMLKLHKKYPKYGLDKHKGYGTKKHIKAIRKFGPSPIHRRTFKIKI